MLIKRRIMSRGRIAAIMASRLSDTEADERRYTSQDRRQAEIDAFFHMLADGKEIKIYVDTNMGGTVVEYDDGN